MSLAELAEHLRSTGGMRHKQDIAAAYAGLGGASAMPSGGSGEAAVRIGDDTAAIPDGDGYLLFAIEGLLEAFVRAEPWFAGYCGVMVNLSDVNAMGGRAIAVVDALWSAGPGRAEAIFAGMRDAAQAYGVPIVGGHTNVRSDGDRLAVAVLGRAKRLLTSFDARPGDMLLAAIDLRGDFFGDYPYWNCSTGAPHERLRGDMEILPELAEAGLAHACKDISMGGILGTLLMLLECSHVGAGVRLDAIPRPPRVALERWLETFPSFGYVLAIDPEHAAAVCERFRIRDIACAPIGTFDAGARLTIERDGEREVFWDLDSAPFTGANVRAAC